MSNFDRALVVGSIFGSSAVITELPSSALPGLKYCLILPSSATLTTPHRETVTCSYKVDPQEDVTCGFIFGSC
jgi:hypothetical protein